MKVIYHNPKCGTSRTALALLEATDGPVRVVRYLEEGWTRGQLVGLLAAAGLTPKEALRHKGTPAGELGLTAEGADDETILSAMVEHPILVERPFVSTPKGVRLCRPPERALALLDGPFTGPVSRGDTVLIDENGQPQV